MWGFFGVFYQKWLDPNQKTIESYLKPCQQILKPRAGGACSSPWVGMAALATAVGFTPTCCAKLSWHWATGRIVGWRCKKTSLGRCLKLEPLVSFGWMLLGRFGKMIFNSCRCDGLTFVFFLRHLKDISDLKMQEDIMRNLTILVLSSNSCFWVFGVVSWLPQAFCRWYPGKARWMTYKSPPKSWYTHAHISACCSFWRLVWLPIPPLPG